MWADIAQRFAGIAIPLGNALRERSAQAVIADGCASCSGSGADSPMADVAGAFITDVASSGGFRDFGAFRRIEGAQGAPVQNTPPGRLSSPSVSPQIVPTFVRKPTFDPAQYTITPLYVDDQVTTTPRPPDAALATGVAPTPEGSTRLVTPEKARDRRRASARQVATFALVLMAIAVILR